MLKRQKEIDRKVDELLDQLYEVEGEIIEYLTHFDINSYVHSTNYSSYPLKEFNRIENLTEEDKGSAVIKALTPEVCQEILPWPDGSIESVLIQLKGINGKTYYLIDVRGYIPYRKGDLVKIIIKRDESLEYQNIYAIIHLQKNILWTPILIERGRIASLKTGFAMIIMFLIFQTVFIFFIGLFFLFLCLFSQDCEYISEMLIDFPLYCGGAVLFLGTFFISLWWFFPYEPDYIGNIRAEAVFKKLGFNGVKFLDLEDYSSYKINKKNKIQVSDFNVEREARNYLLEIALKEHNRKYKK